MTIYSKRRGKRSLAAILAAMLAASVLAVVAGSPASAATTAFEVKVDHDNNAKTATVREFAGQDRYDTALRLAKNFATAQGGLGSVPAAFVASGETLVDSISVAGLAGYTNAPILLTPTGSLHGGVKDFIEDYGVSSVYVLGGTAAISDAAVTAIEGLSNKPKVTRIAGADRYATAAATAGMIKTGSSWCGTSAKSAVLINGASEMLGYGVAAQTAAYRLQLPVLMTAADELPDATADYISDNNIEHVQIIGGTSAVSADVAAALTSLGVDTVARVAGDSAAAVSVELAKLSTNGCSEALAPVSRTRVALVRANPDGVVGAPALASSFAGGDLVTPLVVGDSLPASVRDYLAATPKAIGGSKLNLGIVAIGGTAAVSQATMDAALAAAASAGALTVSIGSTADVNKDGKTDASDPIFPAAGTSTAPSTFLLHFSDDVSVPADGNALLNKVQDVIEVNGVPAKVNTAIRPSAATAVCNNRTIQVTLGQPLAAGDTISIAASALKFGTDADQRTVGAASATVQRKPVDGARPQVTIIGIAGGEELADVFTVRLSDNMGLKTGTSLQNADFEFVPAPGKGTADNNVISSTSVDVGSEATKTASGTVTIGRPLEVGDRLTLKPGKVADTSGNMSVRTSVAAFKAQASPRVTSVQMSQLNHTASNVWTVPSSLVGGATGNHVIRVTSKTSGDAAGAAGNDWVMLFDRSSTHSAAKPLDISVSVSEKSKRVSVVFRNGPATANLGDLLKAMNGHAGFAEHFSAGFATCNTADPKTALGLVAGDNPPRDQIAGATGAGRTRVAIEVRFDRYTRTVVRTGLLTDVLRATMARRNLSGDNALSDITAAPVSVVTTSGSGAKSTEANAAGGLDLGDSSQTYTAPSMLVRYQATTANVANLPRSGDLVDVAAGIGTRTVCASPSAPAIETAVAAIATGYLADQAPRAGVTAGSPCDRVDESMNGASQRRIAVSSTVKAPPKPTGDG